jgi:hypothetical protein
MNARGDGAPRRWQWSVAVVLTLSAAGATVMARREQASLPAALESFLREEARGSVADRASLLAGAPVTKLLDADRTTEVAVFGAIWVAAPSTLYVERLKNIEQFERGGGFRITKRFSDPPSLDDLAALQISDEDFDDLQDCRVGDCALKLDAVALQRLREDVDWQKPSARADANALFRRLALDYVRRYRAGGNANLAVYRDHERPTYVANEFHSMIDRLPRLATQLPHLRAYLLDYPQAVLPGSTDFLYWQEVQFGLKPTFRISHLVIQERPGSTVVASKMLYASHYFWTALEVRLLLEDPSRGRGFWLITVNRSRSDGLSGFKGRIIGGRARSEAQNGARSALIAVKTKLESR